MRQSRFDILKARFDGSPPLPRTENAASCDSLNRALVPYRPVLCFSTVHNILCWPFNYGFSIETPEQCGSRAEPVHNRLVGHPWAQAVRHASRRDASPTVGAAAPQRAVGGPEHQLDSERRLRVRSMSGFLLLVVYIRRRIIGVARLELRLSSCTLSFSATHSYLIDGFRDKEDLTSWNL